MKAYLLGVRGSTSAPGSEFVRYGGHTSCIAIERPDDRWLILDAGTGFRRLAGPLNGGPLRGSILLSHVHWDHTEGLPFLPNADRDDAEVTLYVPRQSDGRAAVDVIADGMQPPSFPIRPEQLGGTWVFADLDEGTREIEGLQVTSLEITHKGGRTYGYRISDESASLTYVPDHAFNEADGVLRDNVLELSRDSDVLLHDTQFLDTQRGIASAYGHSTVSDSLALATEAGVKHLVMFHHAPARTDDELDAIAAGVPDQQFTVTLAREGDVLSL